MASREELIEKFIRNAVRDGVIRAVLYLAIAIFIVNQIGAWFAPKDSTDSTHGRSGMSVLVDAQTGCQYLSTPHGGLTPRISHDGGAMCP